MTRRSFFVKDRYDFSVVFFGCLSGSLWSSSFLFLVFESGSCRLDRSESWSLPISFANQLISNVHPQRYGLKYRRRKLEILSCLRQRFIFYNHLICQEKEHGHKLIWSSTKNKDIDFVCRWSQGRSLDTNPYWCSKTENWFMDSEFRNQKSKIKISKIKTCQNAIRFVHKHVFSEDTLNVLFQKRSWAQHIIHIKKSIDMFLNVWLTQSRTPINIIPELGKYSDEPISECLPTSMASDPFQDYGEHNT